MENRIQWIETFVDSNIKKKEPNDAGYDAWSKYRAEVRNALVSELIEGKPASSWVTRDFLELLALYNETAAEQRRETFDAPWYKKPYFWSKEKLARESFYMTAFFTKMALKTHITLVEKAKVEFEAAKQAGAFN